MDKRTTLAVILISVYQVNIDPVVDSNHIIFTSRTGLLSFRHLTIKLEREYRIESNHCIIVYKTIDLSTCLIRPKANIGFEPMYAK